MYRGAMTTSDWVRGGATAMAAARTAIGVVALAAPTLVTRPWLGPDRGPAARVLGRALGGRDLALGLGALAALQQPPAGPRSAGHPGMWIGVGALSDATDVLATRGRLGRAAAGRPVAGRHVGGRRRGGRRRGGLLLTGSAGPQLTEAAADGA